MKLYDKKYVYFEWDKELEGKKGFVAQNIASLKNQVNNNSKTMVTLSNSDDDVCPFIYYVDDEITCTCNYQFAYYDPFYEIKRAYNEGKQIQYKAVDTGEWCDCIGYPSFFPNGEYRIKPEWCVAISEDNLFRTRNPNEDETVLFEGTEEECIKQMEKYKKFEGMMLAWKHGKTIQYKNKETNEWTDWVLNSVPRASAFNSIKEWRIKEEYVPFDTVQELIDAWESKHSKETIDSIPLIWIKEKEKDIRTLITEYYFERDCHEADVGTSRDFITLERLFYDYAFLDGSIIGKVEK